MVAAKIPLSWLHHQVYLWVGQKQLFLLLLSTKFQVVADNIKSININ